MAALAIFISREEDGPVTRSVTVAIKRFNKRTSEEVRCTTSKLFSKSSIALRVLVETDTELQDPDRFVF